MTWLEQKEREQFTVLVAKLTNLEANISAYLKECSLPLLCPFLAAPASPPPTWENLQHSMYHQGQGHYSWIFLFELLRIMRLLEIPFPDNSSNLGKYKKEKSPLCISTTEVLAFNFPSICFLKHSKAVCELSQKRFLTVWIFFTILKMSFITSIWSSQSA